MANFFLAALFTCSLQLLSTSTFGANEPTQPKISALINYCDALPPDNFHVNYIDSDYASLGWVPIHPGAIHTLKISIYNSGNWLTLYTNYSVPGNSYTLYDLEPGYYQASIATNCSSGETSVNVIDILLDFKILKQE